MQLSIIYSFSLFTGVWLFHLLHIPSCICRLSFWWTGSLRMLFNITLLDMPVTLLTGNIESISNMSLSFLLIPCVLAPSMAVYVRQHSDNLLHPWISSALLFLSFVILHCNCHQAVASNGPFYPFFIFSHLLLPGCTLITSGADALNILLFICECKLPFAFLFWECILSS